MGRANRTGSQFQPRAQLRPTAGRNVHPHRFYPSAAASECTNTTYRYNPPVTSIPGVFSGREQLSSMTCATPHGHIATPSTLSCSHHPRHCTRAGSVSPPPIQPTTYAVHLADTEAVHPRSPVRAHLPPGVIATYRNLGRAMRVPQETGFGVFSASWRRTVCAWGPLHPANAPHAYSRER